MKKLLLFLGFIFYLLVPIRQALSQFAEQLTAWENFKATFSDAWQIQWDVTGTPKMIHGTTTSPQIADPQTIATAFLNQLKDVFGFSSVQQNLLYSGTSPTAVDTFVVYHVRFQPHLNGIPILDSRISVHINKRGEIFLVNAMAYRFSAPFDRVAPLLTGEAAKAVAMLDIEKPVVLAGEITTKLGYVYKNDNYILVWRVTIPTNEPLHDWQIDIAQDGIIINKRDITCYATGAARVYLHHPLVSDTVRKPLYNLDSSCYVRGTYADVKNYDTTARAYACNLQFIYDTSNARFDEGNVYYHIQYFVQRFAAMGLPIQKQMQTFVRTTDPNFKCNAAYTPSSKKLFMGPGGTSPECYTLIRNTALEESVIYHELGHYLHDTLMNWDLGWFVSTGEARVLAEGLSDYFAASVSGDPLLHEWALPQTYRTADNNMIYPDSMSGCVWPYCRSQFVSGTCWDIRNLMNEGLHPDKLVWMAISLSEGNENILGFWQKLVLADNQFGNSDNLRAIHFGWIPRWNTTRPPNTNPDIPPGSPYFVPPVSTVYEGNCYLIGTDATQNGAPAAYLDYYWKSKYVTFPMTDPIDVYVNYCPPIVNQTRVDSIWVWVYDGLGGVDSALKVVTIYPQPPPGGGGGSCPFLYVWNGSDFEEDNTILTQTEFSPKEQTVTDYYHIQKSLVAKNNLYNLQLRELTEEKSFIDHIQLLTVDHPIDQNIAVTQEGKIVYTERELAPVAAVDDREEDQLAKVLAKDGLSYTSQQAGFIELTFPNSENNQKDKMIFVTPSPTKKNICKISPLDPPEPKLELIKTEIQDINGNWIELTQAPPRDNYALNYWLVDQNQIELGNTFKVKISWQQSYSADEIKFYLITEQIPIANTYSPLTASHSKTGSILKLVSSEDRQFATLIKGENLDLFFPAQNLPLPEGYTRNFIAKASGYYIPYIPEPTASIPDRFELKDNYPNPFNAVTEIQYSLPEPSEVNLSVFNIMGQKVRTLVEGRQSAGVHKVIWDGKNNSGKVIASGVYFYSIRAGTYIETKKMTLLK